MRVDSPCNFFAETQFHQMCVPTHILNCTGPKLVDKYNKYKDTNSGKLESVYKEIMNRYHALQKRNNVHDAPKTLPQVQMAKAPDKVETECINDYNDENLYVFAGITKYGGIMLPTFLRSLLYTRVPPIIGSCVKSIGKGKLSPHDLEFKRHTETAKGAWPYAFTSEVTLNKMKRWSKDKIEEYDSLVKERQPVARQQVRDFLVFMFSDDKKDEVFESACAPVYLDKPCKFQHHSTVYMDPFDNKHFNNENRNKRGKNAMLYRSQVMGPLFDVANLADVTSKRLTMPKLLGILNSEMHKASTFDDIRTLIKVKCPIPSFVLPKGFNFGSLQYNSSITKNWSKQDKASCLETFQEAMRKRAEELSKMYKDISWAVPYIPHQYYYVACVDEKDQQFFANLFRSHLGTLRERILHFAHSYFNYGISSHRDKRDLRKVRSDLFVKYMRAPRYQQMFASGMDKSQITKIIYDNHIREINAAMESCDIFNERIRVVKTAKDKLRSKMRDIKYNANEIELQSSNSTRHIPLYVDEDVDVVEKAIKEVKLNFYWHFARRGVSIFTDGLWYALNSVAWFFVSIFMYMRTFGFLFGWYKFFTKNRQSKLFRYVDEWNKMLSTRGSYTLSQSNKLMVLEIKSILHILVHLYRGDKWAVLEWTSNFGITRIDELFRIFGGIKPMVHSKPDSGFNYRGKVLSSAMFADLLSEYNTDWTDEQVDEHVNDIIARERIQPQVGIADFSAVFEQITAMFPSFKLTQRNIADLNQQFTLLKNIQTQLSNFSSIFSTMISVICRVLFAYDPLDPEFQTLVTSVVDLSNYADKMFLIKDDFVTNILLRDLMIEKFAVASQIYRHPRFMMLPTFMQKRFTDAYALMRDMAKLCSCLKSGMHYRHTPLHVIFTGPPGVGKSAAVNYFQTFIASLDGLDFDPSMTYPFNSDSEYWEGYKQQKFVTIDDFGKSADTKVRSIEMNAVINMINTSVFNLNMAFAGKGTTFFDSEYVFTSTNLNNDGEFDDISWNLGATDLCAFKRRCHVVLRRVDRLDDSVPLQDVKFEIKQCLIDPSLKGKQFTTCELGCILKGLKLKADEKAKTYRYTSKDVFAHLAALDMSDLPSYVVDNMHKRPDVKPQSFRSIYRYVFGTNRRERDFFSEIDKLNDQDVDELKKATDVAKIFEYGVRDYTQNDKPDTANYFNRVFSGECNYDTSQHNYENNKAFMKVYHSIDPRKRDIFIHRWIENKFKHNDPYTPYEHMLMLLRNGLLEFFGLQDDMTAEYKICLYFVLIGLGVAFTIYTTTSYFHKDTETVVDQSRDTHFHASMRKKTKTDPKKVKVVTLTKGVVDVQTQSNEDIFHSALQGKVSKCLVYAELEYKDTSCGIMRRAHAQGFRIKDNYFGFPGHFLLEYMRYDNALLTLSFGSNVVSIPLPDTGVRIGDTDFVVIKLDGLKQYPAECYKFLLNQDNSFPIESGIPLYVLSIQSTGNIIYKKGIKSYIGSNAKYDSSSSDTFILESTLNYFFDAARTVSGDSGALVLLMGAQGQAFIAGMHVAVSKRATKEYGIAMPLCAGYIDQIIEAITPQSEESTFPMKILYTVPMDEAAHCNAICKFQRTHLFGWNGAPTKIPVRMRPFVSEDGIEINPLHLAMRKLRQDVFVDNYGIPEIAYEYLMLKYPPTGQGKILEFDATLNADALKGYNSINFSSSAGYPKSLNKTKGKDAYITLDNGRYYFKPEFLKELIADDETLRSGNNINILWADKLKSETRAISKVRAGKVRLFSTCPINFLFLLRRYFLDFIAHIQSKCVECPVSVGVNAHSLDWTLLKERLTRNGFHISAGDFVNYDGNLPSHLYDVFLRFVNDWYDDGEVNARVRRLLIDNIKHAKHICGIYVYQTEGSSPSGHAFTSILNSIFGCIMFVTVLTQDFKLSTNDFELALYGDDNILGSTLKLSTADLAPYFLKRFGLEYTHCSKVQDVEIYDTIDTISYLGRRFERDFDNPHFYRAPLELTTIDESCYWREKGTVTMEETVVSTVRSMYIEYSHHGREVFAARTTKLLSCIKDEMPQIYDVVANARLTYSDYYTQMYDKQTIH